MLNFPKLKKGVCAAVIDHGDISFKCLDCGEENDYHIFCKDCFKIGKFDLSRTSLRT